MKNLKDNILEKLIINKSSKIKKYVPSVIKATQKIIKWLDLDWIKEYQNENSEIFKSIEDWVIDCGIVLNDLEPAANVETIAALSKLNQSWYNDDYTLNEYCNNEIDHTHILDENNHLGYEVRYSDKMICNISSIGTLYVIIKDKFKY